MRPAQQKKSVKAVRPRSTDVPVGPFEERRPLRPIGPAALRNLREAIRSGRYPDDASVRSGIERLLRRSE